MKQEHNSGKGLTTAVIRTQIGNIEIEEKEGNIVRIGFTEEANPADEKNVTSPILREAIQQLQEYFAGQRKEFDLPIKMQGTEFQKKVWQALQEIPYGEVSSYGKLAEKIGNAKACRAVGMANHRNPIAIVVPCHRVIGSNGKVVGYAGGLDKKEWLLEMEKKYK